MNASDRGRGIRLLWIKKVGGMLPSARIARTALWFVLAICNTAFPAGDPLPIRWRTGASLTTRSNAEQTAEKVARFVPQAGARHLVVQFALPVMPDERKRLEAAGLTLLNYLGDNAFFSVVTADGVRPDLLARVPSLTEATPVRPLWKLHPLLVGGGRLDWAAVKTDARGDPVIGTYVVFHRDVPFATAGVAAVGRCGGTVRAELRSVNGLVVELSLAQIAVLADEDIVQYIEPALPLLEGLNAENRALVGADTVQATPYNLDGSGITVLVYDAGRAMSFTGAAHPDVDARLTLGDSAPSSDHSMHVACTVGGDGLLSGGTSRGMAPAVSLLSYGFQSDGSDIFLYTNPGDLEADYLEAITTHGADLANNSIGTNTCANGFPCTITGDYGVTSALIDAVVAGSLGEPFRVLFAGGNERACLNCPLEHQSGYHSTVPPACAKNHITVGAVNANDDSMTFFSSWGPTDDGRLKPDIVAPGCQIAGDAGVTSCGISASVFGYSVSCGTSMAAPTVSGLAALLIQDFRTLFPNDFDPRNATLKALLAQNAVDLGNLGPDYQYGYGSVRIQPTIDAMRAGAFFEARTDHLETYTVFMEVLSGDPELKVTLAWDDLPGTPNVDPALVNDLDLRVFDPSETQFFPWTLDPNNPATPAVQIVADHLNNIEQVVISAPTPGTYRVEVLGFNVPSGPQAFTLAGSPNLLTPNLGSLAPLSVDRPLVGQHTVVATYRQGLPPFAAIPSASVTFDVISGPNVGATATTTTDVNGQASFNYTSTGTAGTDQIQATFDDGGVPRLTNIATASWVPDTGALTPSTSSGNPGDQHTVLLTLTQGGAPFDPISGTLITFDVTTGPNTGATGSATTDVSGQASFMYTGADVAGTDQIQASFLSGGVTQFSNVATHDWLAGTITLSPTAVAIDECTSHTVTATLVQGAPPSGPIVGSAVDFEILSGPNVGITDTVISDGGGLALFTYTDFGGAGVDQIQASFFNASATQTSATVAANWLPASFAEDCNANGISDACEPGFSLDCNINAIPDICDVAPIVGFAAPVANAVNDNPFSVAAADFDGVQGIDLAVGNAGTASVSVLLNGGAGALAAAVNYATTNPSSGVAIGDFDSDTDLDIATIAHTNSVELLINNGSALFTTGSLTNTLGDRAVAIATGDFDGVNGQDVVVASRNSDNVSVLLNNGNATFATAVLYTAGGRPHALAVADFDGVNGPDIAVVNNQSDTLSILLNNGAGVFPAFPTNSFAGTAPVAITAVDLDADGDIDLVVTANGTNSITFHINNGSGAFQPGGSKTVGLGPQGITAGDLDGDGDPDLAVANYGSLIVPGSTLSIFVNHGDATFEPETVEAAGTNLPLAITSGDFDQDGVFDLAVTHDLIPGSVTVLTAQLTRTSQDCNANGIPDECEPDADTDGVPDVCDICPNTFPESLVDATGCAPLVACSSTGTLILDRTAYNCADSVSVQVVDCDLNANSALIETITATLVSDTEPAGEVVTLTETAVDSAVFEGSIMIGTADIVGTVQVAGGDSITATYVDADDGLGGVSVNVADSAVAAANCLDVTVGLESVDTATTRDVTFLLTNCVSMATESIVVSVDFDASGIGTATLTLTDPNVEWISANEAHSLRALMPLDFPLPTSIAFTGVDRLLAADFSGDEFIDLEDLSILASNFNTIGDAADVNGDGVQDTIDFTAIVVNFFLAGDAIDGCGL